MLLKLPHQYKWSDFHSKMHHKTQSHCSPNFIFVDVFYNSYMYTIYFSKKKKRIPPFENYVVKDQIWRPWKHNCAEYVGVIGHWKGNCTSFEMSIKWALYLNRAEVMPLFLRQLVPNKQVFDNFGCVLSKI
jgi:hypothetical protein